MKRLIPFLFALGLLGLASYTSILLFANLSYSQVVRDINSWKRVKQIPDTTMLERSEAMLQRALNFDENNPEYLTSAAELLKYRAVSFNPRSNQQKFLYQQLLAQYQQLLIKRPSWAPYWTSIIALKYELWEYDDTMIRAIHNAAYLAPWFKSNQLIILITGYHGWPFIDMETRKIINKTLERAIKLQPKETIELSFNQGFSERLVPYLQDDEELAELFEKEMVIRKNRLLRIKKKEESLRRRGKAKD